MIAHLRAAGTSLVLDARGTGVPVIVHWGRDLGDLDHGDLAALADSAVPAVPPSSIDAPLRLSVLPTQAQGWVGRPSVAGFWSGGEPGPADFHLAEVRSTGPRDVSLVLVEPTGRVSITTELTLSTQGVLRARHTLDNLTSVDLTTEDPYGTVLVLASVDVLLPIPARAQDILDFSGLWSAERRPQRTSLAAQGAWTRETRHGRPGHDDPYLMIAGTPGFTFRTGEVWALHLAWSGDKRLWAEHQAQGYSLLGAGELLAPGEIRLGPGQRHTTPWVVAAWSDEGLDGLSARFHPWIRSWSRTARPRPVVLNTWEAVYFDQDETTLRRLVDAAAAVGVERFVLDDGWFTGRSDDRRALGDWEVDADTWPDGLHPLMAHVHERGMDFGLWVEPEMVSPDSQLAREHPEWILGPRSALTWRHQRVLDLSVAGAFDHVLSSLTSLLTQYPIAFLKWDHNRDLLDGSAHRQTAAVYRLIDALRRAFPNLEIESCASGGARIDLGMLERVDRFWTSDTNDPLERHRIHQWTGILVPPELLGVHLGAATSHTTGRTFDLSFRLATAFFANAGIEWDLTRATDEELRAVRRWVSAHKDLRGLLHSGTTVNSDTSDPALVLHGVVAPDRRSAVFALTALGPAQRAIPAPVRFPGLGPSTRYTVRPLVLGVPPRTIQDAEPGWIRRGEVTLDGRALADVGLPMPLLAPGQAGVFLIETASLPDHHSSSVHLGVDAQIA